MAKHAERKAFEAFLKSCIRGVQSSDLPALLHHTDIHEVDRLVARTGLDGFLMSCSRITGTISHLPDTLVQGMLKRHGLTMMKNEIIRSHLDEVSRCFNNARIRYVVLKGIQIINRIYPEFSCRSVGDIDIFIHPEDYRSAAALLESSGFSFPDQAMHAVSDVYDKNWVEREMREISYVRPAWPDAIRLDIHLSMEIFRNHEQMNQIFPIGKLDWLSHATVLNIDGLMIPCLDDEYELLHMIFHYSIWHSFMGHKWLVDICRMLQVKADSLDWKKIYDACHCLNLRRLVSLTLSLCASIGGPDLIPEAAKRYFLPVHRSLAYTMARRIMFKNNTGIRGRFYRKFYNALLPAGFCDKLSVMNYYLFDTSSLKTRLGDKYSKLPAFFFPFILLKVTISEYIRNRRKQRNVKTKDISQNCG